MKGATKRTDNSTRKRSKVFFVSWEFRSTSTLKLGSTVLSLLLLFAPLTIAPTIFQTPPVFAIPQPVDAANAVVADINGQLITCNSTNTCITAKFQSNASGPDTADLAGILLIYGVSPAPSQPCMANVTGNVAISTDGAPTATLTGTLTPANPAATACVGGLEGLSVTLFIDSMFGTVRLTTVSPTGVTETLASGWGALTVTQTQAPST
jgi:hypothetical protein